jgi:hypothetical protein
MTEVDDRHCHVQLVADVGNALKEQLTGATVLGAVGAAGTGAALAVGVMVPVAVVPVAVCGLLALVVARRQRQRAAETLVALEQVLDRLEHGEDAPEAIGGPGVKMLNRVAQEIRRSLGA